MDTQEKQFFSKEETDIQFIDCERCGEEVSEILIYNRLCLECRQKDEDNYSNEFAGVND